MKVFEASGEMEKLSGQVGLVKSVTNFLEKAHKLFLLKDDAANAYDNAVGRIEKQHEIETGPADKWATATFLVTAAAVGLGVGVLTAAGGGGLLFPILFGVGAGFIGGLISGLSAYSIGCIGPNSRREERLEVAETRFKELTHEIDFEVKGLEQNLMAQPAEVRSEFREAFRLAVTKQDHREQKIHRAKMEEEAEETREAAQTASAMATIAAVNSAMSSMRR